MNANKRVLISVAALLVTAVLLGGENTPTKKKKIVVTPKVTVKEKKKEKQKKTPKPKVVVKKKTPLPETGNPTVTPRKVGEHKFFVSTPMNSDPLKKLEPPVPGPNSVDGPHIALGRGVKWFINNTVKRNGWGFTGWSKTGLDSNYNPWRLHIGIVSGEMDAGLAYSLTEQTRYTPGYELLEDWNRERSEGVRFGICFTKRFGK